MMANKRNLERMDSLICSKMPRLENEHSRLSAGFCKPSPLPSCAAENPLKYTGSYLAYHLRNSDGTNLLGAWDQPQPYMPHMGNPTIQSQPGDVSRLSSHVYQTEPETGPRPFQPSVCENDKLDLVKDLMNVRSKWVTFVERQKTLRKSQNLPAVLCSSEVEKHSLISPTLSTVNNCANVAFPQPVYRNSVCCSGAGSSLENSAEHFRRRGQETEWRMPPPVTSSCLLVNNSQLMHSPQYVNPLLKSNCLHHGSGNIQVNSMGRITKETGKLPGVTSPLCRGYGTYNSNILQDPRYSAHSYENSNGNIPSHSNATICNIQDFQKSPLRPFVRTEGQQMQLPLYCDKLSPPKYPMPIQPTALHSRNSLSNQQTAGTYSISNQQTAGTYSLLHPHSYKAQVGHYPAPGTGGQMSAPSSTFSGQLSSGNPYAQPSESLGYPAHHPPQQKSVSLTNLLIHPASQPIAQPTEFKPQSPARNKVSPSQQDPTNARRPSPDMLHFRSHIIDAQTNERCYNSLNLLYNKEYAGQQQLISKHSAFHPVLSGKHLKGPFERPAGSPADQRPKDIYVKGHSPSIHIPSSDDRGRSIFSKETENLNNKPVEVGLESPPKSYTESPKSYTESPKGYPESPTRRTSVINFSPAPSPASNESKRVTPPPSPPMPVINNVFSLAPYKAYLEATGLFFSKCQKCQSDCDKSCSCSVENKSQNCRNDVVIDLDSNKQSPLRVPKAINELQPNNTFMCIESTTAKGASAGDELNKMVSETNSLDVRHQEINLTPTLGNVTQQQSGICDPSCAVDHGDEKRVMNRMDSDTALDLSVKTKIPLLDVTWETPVSAGTGEELKSAKEIPNEKNTTEPANVVKQQESKAPAAELGNKANVTNPEISMSVRHKIEINKYKILRPAPPKVGESNPILSPEGITEAKKFSLIGPVDPSILILRPLKRILPDMAKSIVSSVPEARNSPCETKVDLPCLGGLMQHESDTCNYFVHLHQSLCDMITQSVAESSEEVLRACLQDIEGQENQKLRSSSKPKNGVRIFEALKMSKSKGIWRNHGSVPLTLQKLLSRLESYIYSRTCPFPHVIRAGTIFIPIYLVKETLFSSLKGATIDQVFQEHKIELRPTTLSEEKKLQNELQLQRCSSRLIKLLSLKQLPEIYQDLLDVLWHSCVKIHLGEQNDENLKVATFTPKPADGTAKENQSQTSSTETRNITVANTACSEAKPDKGIVIAKHNAKLGERRSKIKAATSPIKSNLKCADSSNNAKLRKRRSKIKAATSPIKSNLKCANLSNNSQSGEKISPQSEKPSCKVPDQDASRVQSGKESKLGPRKVQKRTKGVWDEKAFVKGNFEKKCSTLVVRLNRVAVNGDNKGSGISCTRKIKEAQIPIRKKDNGALRPTRSTSKVLHLRSSIVRLKFQKPRQTVPSRNIVLKSVVATRKPLLMHNSPRLDQKMTKPPSCRKRQGKEYPNLVGKRIKHLYEEKDKSESWYKGVVVKVHEKHQNPLKTVYEVKYDSEPDWQYYLELLQDYENGWLRVDD
ncbi:hypothetical protein scyTo_0005880 [Scyliorhinus torazame]|uniref:Uncharacterized protein n=1 Tax=Scyliorhinus torazame TaxID=75743 RepID=A0A401PDM4_SCYTO|nr:hypothetical protein [Scyliorhinus torazame]